MAEEQENYELYVATFTDEKGAGHALQAMKELEKTKAFKLAEAAVIHKETDNDIKIKETHDTSGGKGAAIGAVVGGAIGLIGGPLAIATGALGAAIGGMAAKMSDAGFPDYQLKQIGEHLRPGMSALVLMTQSLVAPELEEELQKVGAHSVKQAPVDKSILMAIGADKSGYGSVGVGKAGFFEKAAGSTAVDLMNQIVRDENRPTGEDQTNGVPPVGADV